MPRHCLLVVPDAPGAIPHLAYFAILVLLGAGGPGCAITRGSPADQLFHRKDYQAAVVAYQSEEFRRPDDPRIKTNLGISFLRTQDPDRAAPKLEEALALDPGDSRALFFLGQAREELLDIDGALRSYTTYLAHTDRHRADVQAKIQRLSERKFRFEIERALTREDSLVGLPAPENTLAVPDFANVSEVTNLAPLSKGLAAVMITDLRQVEHFRILERERLDILKKELSGIGGTETSQKVSPSAPEGTEPGTAQRAKPEPGEASSASPVENVPPSPAFETAGAIDPATAPRLGRILRTRRFVQGFFTAIGEREIQLHATLIDADTPQSVPTGAPVFGPLSEVLYLEKDLVYQTLRTLGVEPTPEERNRIDRMPTESFEAFLAYSRGLAYRDLGKTDEATAAFAEAAAEDPSFEEAEEAAAATESTEEEFSQIADEVSVEVSTPETTPSDLITEIAINVGNGPAPDDVDTDATDVTGEDLGDATDTRPPDTDRVPESRLPGFPPPPTDRNP